MLSILDTGMNAPTHSTLNDGKHTWMGKPQYNPECGWTSCQWTLASSYGKSIVSPLGDQMVTVCWKKYCMIPVYKEGNILFYILNKIVLTGYTPKKVHRDDYLGKQQSITLHPAISKLQVYVMKWGFFWVWQTIMRKSSTRFRQR